MIGLIDPVGNSVELHDLKPYTYYQLDLRDRSRKKLFARVNFSTAGNIQCIQLSAFLFPTKLKESGKLSRTLSKSKGKLSNFPKKAKFYTHKRGFFFII